MNEWLNGWAAKNMEYKLKISPKCIYCMGVCMCASARVCVCNITPSKCGINVILMQFDLVFSVDLHHHHHRYSAAECQLSFIISGSLWNSKWHFQRLNRNSCNSQIIYKLFVCVASACGLRFSWLYNLHCDRCYECRPISHSLSHANWNRTKIKHLILWLKPTSHSYILPFLTWKKTIFGLEFILMRDDDCGKAKEKYGATFFHHYVRCGRSTCAHSVHCTLCMQRNEYGVLRVCACVCCDDCLRGK